MWIKTVCIGHMREKAGGVLFGLWKRGSVVNGCIFLVQAEESSLDAEF